MSHRISRFSYMLTVLLFAAGGTIGFALTPESAGGSVTPADSGDSSFAEQLSDLTLIASTNFAFAFRLLAGILTLGFYSAFAMCTFGLELGGFLAESSATLPASHITALMLPHGIFELPALFVLASLEFQLAILVGIVLFKQVPETREWHRMARRFGLQALLALAMLAIAAPIEVFITGEIYDLIR